MDRISVKVTQDELFFLELLRRCRNVGCFVASWSEEVEVASRMSSEMLRKYAPSWICIDDVLDERFGRDDFCASCDAPVIDEPDIDYRECPACNDVRSVECWKSDEVDYAFRVLVLADMMLRGMWGDGNTSA